MRNGYLGKRKVVKRLSLMLTLVFVFYSMNIKGFIKYAYAFGDGFGHVENAEENIEYQEKQYEGKASISKEIRRKPAGL